MQPSPHRRVHSAELKAQVIAECREAGASVSAVALAHGLNANLVRKWLVGRGLKRAGLPAAAMAPMDTAPATTAATALQFLPIDLVAQAATATAPSLSASTSAVAIEPAIRIAASRGELQLDIRWPASQAGGCATWLRELLR